jgi:MoaA/NifB/PqqE/SkfB family radical SAM enzyme
MIPEELLKQINIDISNKCGLACPGCNRQKYYDGDAKKVPGRDITIAQMKMIVDYFDRISFCGQVSDPLYHPKFYDLLKLCVDNKKSSVVYHAAVLKDRKQYLKHFLLSKRGNVKWVFALDGLPNQSHLYRKNQDGKKLFEIMKMCAQMGIETEWDCIIFNYNEYNLQECENLASQYNIKLNKIVSSRWWKNCEEMQPENSELYFSARSYVQDMLKKDPEHPWYS